MLKKNYLKLFIAVLVVILGIYLFYSNKTKLVILKKNAQPTTTSQKLKASLSINELSIGLITVPNGANQCDILSQALAEKKIKSLDMRYNKDFKTNAVYQINGIGKVNSPWWTFTVNGQSPNQGCNYIKVKSGDNAVWSYVGN